MSKYTLRPEYYNTDSVYEPIKIIQHYGLCFELSNNLKYILRAGVKNKETEIEDLVKAKTYLQLRIDYLQAQKDLTINIKCEDNLSPVLEEIHEKIQSVKSSIESDKPKLISELKVGDEIKAIVSCLMNDEIDGEYNALKVGKYYKIKRLYDGEIDISSEIYETHTFDLTDLHEYFHVLKE